MRVFNDRDKILKVLKNPVIWESVSNGAKFDQDAFILPDDWLYLTETENEVFMVSPRNKVHINILPEKRGRAFWMIARFYDWIVENTEIKELFLEVHERHKNIIKLGYLFGFERMGISNDRLLMSKRVER